MKFSNQSRAVALFSVLFLIVSSAFTLAMSEEQVSNSPLRGKWEGGRLLAAS